MPEEANTENHGTRAGSPASDCSVFSARLEATDGGDPIDLLEEPDGAQVWRGDDIIGEGRTLLGAWNDYLFSCYPKAPVDDDDLKDMWRKYDSRNAES